MPDLNHISPLLQELHWRRVPERIDFRLAVHVYRCLHGQAPYYLMDELQSVVNIESRWRLRSASTNELTVPCMLHTTIGDRAFPVAAARVWNSLPLTLTSAPSVATCKKTFKNCTFHSIFCEA